MNLKAWMALVGPSVFQFSIGSPSFIMSSFYAIHLTKDEGKSWKIAHLEQSFIFSLPGVPRVLIGIFGLMPAVGFICNLPVDLVNLVMTRNLLTPKQIGIICGYLDCAVTIS